ncbi:uncharacterized protein LOC127081369 [Lathyrus oleraceus]|uniref:uncharacterized protein LOC127081369 n=1 Tax=Pisum sativum TaxID=3888 RepID=UPI0021D07ED5|nr:uncharacterized protein LOC127081369 [Pisum sativum]
MLGSKIVQQTTEKIKMLHDKMKSLESLHKSYHDKRRKKLEFQEGNHVFFKVTPLIGVGRALKSRKLTPHFIVHYQIMKQVGEVTYKVDLPPILLNLHDLFHVSQLRKDIHDRSHMIQMDDVQVRENLTIETCPLRLEDCKVKHFKGKEIALMKVVWGRPTSGSMMWEQESQMKESYPTLFPLGNF